MSQPNFGEIDSRVTYHINTLTSILQLKDYRTTLKMLDSLQVSYVRLRNGRNIFVAGSEFLLAIQRCSEPGGFDPFNPSEELDNELDQGSSGEATTA